MLAALRFTLLCALLSIPGPILYGRGMVDGAPLFLFLALAFVVPLFLKGLEIFRHDHSFPFHKGLLFYSWAFCSIFFIMGTITVPISVDVSRIGLLVFFWVVALTIFEILIMFTMIGLAKWFALGRRGFVKQVLDISIISLPISMLLLGDFLFQDIRNPLVMQHLGGRFFQLLQYTVYLMVMMVMATLAIYLFPRWDDKAKPLRLLRIMVTAFCWLFINTIVLYQVSSPAILSFINTVLPVFRNNFLVYVTPTVFEILALGIAMALGLGVEQGLLKLIDKVKEKRR